MAATALRPVLHRTGPPTRASWRLHADSERRVVTKQARQLTWSWSDRPEPFRYLIRDRDQKFTDTFGAPGLSRALPAGEIPAQARGMSRPTWNRALGSWRQRHGLSVGR